MEEESKVSRQGNPEEQNCGSKSDSWAGAQHVFSKSNQVRETNPEEHSTHPWGFVEKAEIYLRDTDGSQPVNAVCGANVHDEILHPAHYCFGKIEPLAVIEDWKLEFHEATVVKYIARAKHKGSRVSDLKKAAEYLRRKIELLESQRADASGNTLEQSESGNTLASGRALERGALGESLE